MLLLLLIFRMWRKLFLLWRCLLCSSMASKLFQSKKMKQEKLMIVIHFIHINICFVNLNFSYKSKIYLEMQSREKNQQKKYQNPNIPKQELIQLSYEQQKIINDSQYIEFLYYQFEQMLSFEQPEQESFSMIEKEKLFQKKSSQQQLRAKTFQINKMQIFTPNKIPYKILLTEVPKLSCQINFTSQNFIEEIEIILKYVRSWNVNKITCINKPQLKIFKMIEPIRFKELKELNLQNNNITSIEIIQNIQMPKLETLLLHSNLITISKVFKKLSLQNDVFTDLIINSNFIKQFNDFSRIRLRKLRTLRLEFPVPFYLQRPNRQEVVQSQDLIFIVKLEPILAFLRIHHKQRQKQNKIQKEIGQKHWDIYIGRNA